MKKTPGFDSLMNWWMLVVKVLEHDENDLCRYNKKHNWEKNKCDLTFGWKSQVRWFTFRFKYTQSWIMYISNKWRANSALDIYRANAVIVHTFTLNILLSLLDAIKLIWFDFDIHSLKKWNLMRVLRYSSNTLLVIDDTYY